MKNIRKFSKRLLIVFISLAGLSACTTDGDSDSNETNALTQQEKDMLIQMREEEKLARDVYDYLYNKYGETVFDNISNSEQSHMDNILTLLNKYNLPDPALPTPGEFSNTDLQNLYNQLIATGDLSLIDALKVGATIEDLDIYDLEEFSNMTDKADILDVFGKLTCGSRNHMRAFYGQIQAQNATYTPQYISQTEFDDIVNSPNERCGR